MPTSMKSEQNISTRTGIQKVCIAIALAFLFLGLGGIIAPGLMGLHLSMPHNLIHLISGALALWVGYSDSTRSAYSYSVTFGFMYGLLGVLGLFIGRPGNPGVGHMEIDQNLLRIIPNVLELGTRDHILHLFIGFFLLFSAFSWNRNYQKMNKTESSKSADI